MKIHLCVEDKSASGPLFRWSVSVNEGVVALGHATSHYLAARRCGTAFLQYCEDSGWHKKPPAEVQVHMNYIPPLPEPGSQPFQAGVATTGR